MKNLTLKAVDLVLVLALGVMLANNVVFMHKHVLPDGTIVTHAHPYNKSDDSGQGERHQHSKAEYFLLDNLKVLTLLVVVSVYFLVPVINYLNDQYYYPGYLSVFCSKNTGRDPPLL